MGKLLGTQFLEIDLVRETSNAPPSGNQSGKRLPPGGYCRLETPRLREHLLANGAQPGPIEPRFYMEKGEMRVTDPNAYCILIGQG